ncbi:MAG: hypothetical protein ACOC93_04005 [Planctomycetota bacterium]
MVTLWVDQAIPDEASAGTRELNDGWHGLGEVRRRRSPQWP